MGFSSALREAISDVRAMMGLTVLMESVSELLASSPSRLLFPAESEKTPEATEITPSLVLSVLGVKVAE